MQSWRILGLNKETVWEERRKQGKPMGFFLSLLLFWSPCWSSWCCFSGPTGGGRCHILEVDLRSGVEVNDGIVCYELRNWALLLSGLSLHVEHRNLEPLSNGGVNGVVGGVVDSGPGLRWFEMFAVTFQTSGISLFHLNLQFLWLSCIQMAVPFQQGPSWLFVVLLAGTNPPVIWEFSMRFAWTALIKQITSYVDNLESNLLFFQTSHLEFVKQNMRTWLTNLLLESMGHGLDEKLFARLWNKTLPC